MLIGLGKMVKNVTSSLTLLANRIIGYTLSSGSGSGYYGASIVEGLSKGFLLTNFFAPPSYSTDLLQTYTVSPGSGLTPGTRYGKPVAGNGYFIITSISSTSPHYAYSKDAINWTQVLLPSGTRSNAELSTYFYDSNFFIAADQNILVGPDPSSMGTYLTPTADSNRWWENPFHLEGGGNDALSKVHFRAGNQIARWNGGFGFSVSPAAPSNVSEIDYTAGYYVATQSEPSTGSTFAYRMPIDLSSWEEIQIPFNGSYSGRVINRFFWTNYRNVGGIVEMVSSDNAGDLWTNVVPTLNSNFPNLTNMEIRVLSPENKLDHNGSAIFIKGYDTVTETYRSFLSIMFGTGKGITGTIEMTDESPYVWGILDIIDGVYYLAGQDGKTYMLNFGQNLITYKIFPLPIFSYIEKIDNTYITMGYNSQSPGGYVEFYSSTNEYFDNYTTSAKFMGDYYTWSHPVYLQDMTTYVQVQASIGNQADETVEVLAPVDVYTVPINIATTIDQITLKNNSANQITYDLGVLAAGVNLTDGNALINDQAIAAGETVTVSNITGKKLPGTRVSVLPSAVDVVEVKVYGTTSPAARIINSAASVFNTGTIQGYSVSVNSNDMFVINESVIYKGITYEVINKGQTPFPYIGLAAIDQNNPAPSPFIDGEYIVPE